MQKQYKQSVIALLNQKFFCTGQFVIMLTMFATCHHMCAVEHCNDPVPSANGHTSKAGARATESHRQQFDTPSSAKSFCNLKDILKWSDSS